jgi:predicted nucleic acid-binding protein
LTSALVEQRTGKLRAGRASQAVNDLLDAGVRCLPTLPLLPEAWRLRSNVSATDACYVALARDLGCPLVARNLRLSRKPGLGVPMITV